VDGRGPKQAGEASGSIDDGTHRVAAVSPRVDAGDRKATWMGPPGRGEEEAGEALAAALEGVGQAVVTSRLEAVTTGDPPVASSWRGELARLEEKLAAAQQALLDSQRTLAESRRVTAAQRQELEAARADADLLAAHLERERTAHRMTQRDLEGLRERAGNASTSGFSEGRPRSKRFGGLEPDTDPKRVTDELERSVGQAIAERNRLTLALKRLERHFLHAREEVGAWLTSAEVALADRLGLEADARSARSSLRLARDYCESVDLALNVAATELATARNGFGSALDELGVAERKARAFQARSSRLGESVAAARDRLKEVSEFLADFSSQLEALGPLLAGEDAERRELGQAVTDSFTRLRQHEAGLTSLGERLQAQRNALTGLSSELESATEADERLQGEVARRDGLYREHVEAVRTFDALLDEADALISRAHTGELALSERDPDSSALSVGPRAGTPGPVASSELRPPVAASEPAAVDDGATSTLPSVPRLEGMLYARLGEAALSATERIALLHDATPNLDSAALSGGIKISAKAAFLVSCIDGTVTLGDLIDLSGLPHEEAAQLLLDLLLEGHIRLPALAPQPRP
jgi:chromosome segregation ATPase